MKQPTYFPLLLPVLLCLAAYTSTKAQCPTAPMNITLSTQAQIDNFCSTTYPGCSALPAGVNLTIYDIIDGTQDITNLNGLSCLTSIGGELAIFNNPMLSDLMGLDNITSIGGDLDIIGNSMLSDLTGLDNLTSIGGDLDIIGNAMLSDLTGLDNLTSIGGNLDISYNSMLSDLTGLDNLTSIGGNLSISYNAISDLTGLDNLTSIGGNLFISYNSMLSDLTGLDNLTSIGGVLSISYNFMLSDLTGLDNLTSIGGYLNIDDNPMLSDCCVLCPLLDEDNMDDNIIGGSITINSNANGCNSEGEVEACTPCARCTPATIATQPMSTPVCEGDAVALSVTASAGAETLNYQWQVDCGTGFNDIAGETSATLNLANLNNANACDYQVVISGDNVCEVVTSDMATLMVNPLPDVSLECPVTLGKCTDLIFDSMPNPPGGTFSGTLIDNFGASVISSAGIIDLSNIPNNASGGQYSIIYTYTDANNCSFSTSCSFLLEVKEPVIIATQPMSTSVCEGDAVTFSVTASAGTETLSYQWQVDCGTGFNDIAGETSATLNLTNLSNADACDYQVIISGDNVCEALTSDMATLTVNSLPDVSLECPVTLGKCTASMFDCMPNPSGGIFSGTLIDNFGAGVISSAGIIDISNIPTNASGGQYSIIYTYTDPATACTNSASCSFNLLEVQKTANAGALRN